MPAPPLRRHAVIDAADAAFTPPRAQRARYSCLNEHFRSRSASSRRARAAHVLRSAQERRYAPIAATRFSLIWRYARAAAAYSARYACLSAGHV